MNKFVLFAGIAFAVAAPAHAASTSGNTSTAPGTAAANIITPIVLSHTTGSSLNFGSFTTGTGGTVTVGADGTGSTTADVGFVPGSTEAADQFTVKGDLNRSFSISTGSGSVAFAGTSISFSTTPSAVSGKTDGTGAASFSVGGTLTVAGTEGPGAYTGTYNATVTYN